MVAELISIEVAYARPEAQTVLTLRVAPGTMVQEAIRQSGILTRYPEIDLGQQAVGIYSRLVKLTDAVNSGDRVEIYRPLLADPKEIRRQRAEQAKLRAQSS
ncbi:MAG: RnfH family protein [Aeromonas sp.]